MGQMKLAVPFNIMALPWVTFMPWHKGKCNIKQNLEKETVLTGLNGDMRLFSMTLLVC
jgi:hypothetical protein